MTSEELETFFKSSAALNKMPDCDPLKPELKQTVDKLKAMLISEYLSGPTPTKVPAQKEPSLTDALSILINTCNAAGKLEFEHRPNNLTDEQLKEIAFTRQMAIEMIVTALSKTNLISI